MSCTFTNAGSSQNQTVEDFPQAVWHGGAAWQATGASTTLGSATVTFASGHFNAATDINHTVAGPAVGSVIPANSFIVAVNSPTSITLNNNATATKSGLTAFTLTISNSSTRGVTDGVTTSGSTTILTHTARVTAANGHTTILSTTITSATAAFASPADVGATVSGTGIPANDTIASVTNATTAVLTTAATATHTTDAFTIVDTGGSTANFTSGDVGRIVTGTNLPLYDTIASVTNANTAVLTTAATASGVAQSLTIGANEQTSSTREVTDASISSGSPTLTSASANFVADDLQLPVIGCGIPLGTYITAAGGTTATLSQNATATRPFAVSDGTTSTAGLGTTVTSATANFSTACDANKSISGAGIPAGAYIKTVTNSTTVVISAKATATASGVSLTESPGATEVIGLPSVTAPANGDAVSTIGTTLTLNPTLVKGAQPCAAGQPAGETIEGGWYSPGAYQANTLALAPANLPTNTIGEILYPTSVVSFAAYVQNEAASTPGEQDAAAHTDIILPFIPTSLALCASPALGIGSNFSYNGSTLAQQKIATGVGTPGTAAVRGIMNLGSGVPTTTGTAWLTQNPPKGSAPYSGSCTTNFPAAVTATPCS